MSDHHTLMVYACWTLKFFYRYARHLILHSFPTRRSSDLADAFAEAGVAVWLSVQAAEPTGSMPGWGTRKHDGLHRNADRDRKSTRLNSSHLVISYAVFCLKKKKS